MFEISGVSGITVLLVLMSSFDGFTSMVQMIVEIKRTLHLHYITLCLMQYPKFSGFGVSCA